METYEFAFVVDADPNADDFEDRFFAAGCDDATIIVRQGAAVLCFDRESTSYKEAALTAYENIVQAGSNIVRFEPDYLVSPSEIADRANITRAAVGLYISGARKENFPAPYARMTTKSPLWDWVQVSEWMYDNEMLPFSEHKRAMVSRILNLSFQLRNLKSHSSFDIRKELEVID